MHSEIAIASTALIHKYTKTQVQKYTHTQKTQKYTHTHTHKKNTPHHTVHAQRSKFNGIALSEIAIASTAQLQKYKNTQIHKNTNTQIHKYTYTQIYKYPNTQIHKFTNTQGNKVFICTRLPELHKN